MQRRAEFIWTPDQKVAANLSFQKIIGQGPVRRDDGQNRWYLFRKSFSLANPPDSAELDITVDGKYRLYVNGQQIGRGPSRCSPYYQRVDSYDINRVLSAGENTVAVLVHVYGVDTAWYETVKDYWQMLFGDGGLYSELRIEAGDASKVIVTDSSWCCIEAAAWNRDTPKSGWGQDFIEDYDARLAPVDWTQSGFDDGHWQSAQVLVDERDAADKAKGFGRIRAFPTLIPRDIPALAESPVTATEVLAVYAVTPQPELPIDARLYNESLAACPENCIDAVNALLVDDENVATIRTTSDIDVAVLIAFDELHAGYPAIDIEAQGGEVIEVAVAETYPGEFDTPTPDRPRLAQRSFLDCAHVFRYTARPGRQRFEKFEWAGVRYLQLVVRNAPEGLKIRYVNSIATHYPVKNEGAFKCSDEVLNRLWNIGRHTVLQCSHDAWEDCPGREKRQWLGDGVARYPIAAAAFGTSIQPLDRRFLLQCLESQRADGLLQMYAPGDHKTYGVVIPDYSLHYILIAHDYLMHTGDLDTIETVLPAIQKALAWYERQVGANNLLVDVPFWHFIEWANIGRNGEATSINALYAGALQAASDIAKNIGNERMAMRCRENAERVGGAINERLWDPDRRVYVDGSDPYSGKQFTQVSQQANALILLFDIAPDERREAIVGYITDTKRLKLTAVPPVVPVGEKLNPQTDVVRCNTFFSHFLYSALARCGRFDLALQQIRKFYEPMLATGTTTLWESFDPSASLCHAFSATPLYQLSANSLGVRPSAPGFVEFTIAPQFGDLDFAEGTYPTPAGGIDVRWWRKDATTEVEINSPPGLKGIFVIPKDHRLLQGSIELATGTNRLSLTQETLHDG